VMLLAVMAASGTYVVAEATGLFSEGRPEMLARPVPEAA